MEFTFNGVIPNSIYFNNNDLNRVTCNGVTVWEKYRPTNGPLNFTSVGNSEIYAISQIGTRSIGLQDVKYSFDGTNWTKWTAVKTYDGGFYTQYKWDTISLSDGQTIYFKGYNPDSFSYSSSNTYALRAFMFNMTVGTLYGNGNVMSLIDNGRCDTTIIPSTSCFDELFRGCTALITPPMLPATRLTIRCYEEMFIGCYNLRFPPQLPATYLDEHCYDRMFRSCTSLAYTPDLPATTLKKWCYASMFDNCTSLTMGPVLPAKVLPERCYNGMFGSCSNLRYIKCLATDNSGFYCTSGWLTGVAASGTFVKDSTMTSWTSDANGIPEGWIVQDA